VCPNSFFPDKIVICFMGSTLLPNFPLLHPSVILPLCSGAPPPDQFQCEGPFNIETTSDRLCLLFAPFLASVKLGFHLPVFPPSAGSGFLRGRILRPRFFIAQLAVPLTPLLLTRELLWFAPSFFHNICCCFFSQALTSRLVPSIGFNPSAGCKLQILLYSHCAAS